MKYDLFANKSKKSVIKVGKSILDTAIHIQYCLGSFGLCICHSAVGLHDWAVHLGIMALAIVLHVQIWIRHIRQHVLSMKPYLIINGKLICLRSAFASVIVLCVQPQITASMCIMHYGIDWSLA